MTHKETGRPAAGVSRVLITLSQVILYIPIQILFIPLAAVGIIHGVYRGMVKSRRLGVSFSAITALQYRWFMHHFDTRPDPLSVAFTKKLPCESHFGLWSFVGALVISQRLFGFTTRLGKLPEPGEDTLASSAGRRLLVFDRIMEKYVHEVEQIVLPGVGFDLKALRFTKGRNLRVFELDQVGTLNVQTDTLRRAAIEHDWVTYIPVDYAKESWVDKLLEAGFDKTRKTLFIWESVSLFLEADVVKETLGQMAGLGAPGSTIAQDFYSRRFVSGEISRTVKRTSKLMARMGEPWEFGIDMTEDPRAPVEAFLEECGLRIKEFHPFGLKRHVEPFYCIVECEKA